MSHFYSPLAPKLKRGSTELAFSPRSGRRAEADGAVFQYAATLFQKAINILGAIPANEPGDNYVQYFNLSPTLVLGRRVANKILSTIGKNKSRYISQTAEGSHGRSQTAGGERERERERDEVIFDAALGIEVGAGVCDTYAAVVSFLALQTSGPAPGKTVYVSQSGGHTIAFVYNIKIDAHNEIVFNEIARRSNLDVSSLVNMTNISDAELQKKYDEYSRSAHIEIEKIYTTLSEREKLAFLEFKKIKDPGGIGSLEARSKVALFLEKKRLVGTQLRTAKKEYKKALRSGNNEAIVLAENRLKNAEKAKLDVFI